MESVIYNTIGTIGVLFILVTYFSLQTGRIQYQSFWYSFFNLIGSSMILFSLFFEWNFASFVIEVFWAIISFYGLYRYYARRRRQPAPVV